MALVSVRLVMGESLIKRSREISGVVGSVSGVAACIYESFSQDREHRKFLAFACIDGYIFEFQFYPSPP
jgi:hypothetical protein